MGSDIFSDIQAYLQRQRDDPDDEPPPLTFEFLPADFLIDHGPAPRPVAIAGILRVGDLAIVTGSFDTFKSTFVLELVKSLTSGEHFLGHFPVINRLRMAILQAEIDPGSYRSRLRAVEAGPDLIARSDFTFSFDRLPELIRDLDGYYDWDGIVFDPIGQMWPAYSAGGEAFNENAKTHIAPIMKALKLIDKTVILVHHDPKPSQGQRNRAAGSSALLNDPDTRIFLDRADPLVTVTVRSRLQSPAGRFDCKIEGRRLRFLKNPSQTP